VILALGAALASVIFSNHLSAALSLGVMGYAVGGLFLLEPAPDVALVQFLVETLGTVLVIVMIGRIAKNRRLEAISVLWDSSRGGVWRDVAISVIIGVTVGLFALTAINNRPDRESIAAWHIENAYEETGVTDVVAAILADFRATDTILEIIVFSMAALGVLTVLTLSDNPSTVGKLSTNAPPDRSPLNTPLARAVARLVLPFAFLISLTHLFYAGSLPGDGFTAGVISGLGVALWYVVFGYQEAKARLQWLRPWWLVSGGLALALGNAVLPLLFGEAFFYHTTILAEAPAGLHISSTLFFEIGIAVSIFGSASMIIETIAHPEGVERFTTQEMEALRLEDVDDDSTAPKVTFEETLS